MGPGRIPVALIAMSKVVHNAVSLVCTASPYLAALAEHSNSAHSSNQPGCVTHALSAAEGARIPAAEKLTLKSRLAFRNEELSRNHASPLLYGRQLRSNLLGVCLTQLISACSPTDCLGNSCLRSLSSITGASC